MRADDRPRPKLLFLVTVDWYFCSHRLPLALAAQAAGYEVAVATQITKHAERIRRSGLKLIPIQLSRHGKNLFRELGFVFQLVRLYRREHPDLVHHVALKPVLYGSIAARLAGVPHLVNAIAGLGFLYTSSSLQARLLRPLINRLLKSLLGRANTLTIVQNPDQARLLTRLAGIEPSSLHLIRGAGVDLEAFRPAPEPLGTPVVILASRLIWHKGIREFVRAAEILRSRGVDARFALVGEPDTHYSNPISDREIQAWQRAGVVEYWGFHADMAPVFARSHIVCLPTYGEGLPKVLIEAAACGRPIVTSDVPGCREIVLAGENGLLVPLRDAHALADALQTLIERPSLRQRFGSRSREIAAADFGLGKVIEQTLSLYRRALHFNPT